MMYLRAPAARAAFKTFCPPSFEPQFMVALCSRAHLVWCVVFRQGSKLVDDDLRARSLYRGVDSLGIECARKESLSAILFESLET